MAYEPWMLAAMEDAGYNGVHGAHMHTAAEA